MRFRLRSPPVVSPAVLLRTSARRALVSRALARCALATLATLALVATIAASPADALQRPLTLEWELGGIGGAPEVMWEGPLRARLIDDAVYVLDSRAPAVRKFTLDGEFETDLGRDGQGPGEYQRPTYVRAAGDTIAVWDIWPRRWVMFDRAGNHLETAGLHSYPNLRYPSLTEHYGEVAGFQLALTAAVIDDSQEYPQALIQWRTPEAVDTLGLIPRIGVLVRSHPEGQWNGRGRSPGPSGDVDIVADTVVFLNGMEPSLTLFVRTGRGAERALERALPGSPSRLGDAARNALDQRYREGRPAGEHFEIRLPEALPAWSRVRHAGDGRIWLRRGGEPEMLGGVEEWVPWTADGGLGRGVSLHPRERLLDISGDLMLVQRTGEYDELYLRLYRIGPA